MKKFLRGLLAGLALTVGISIAHADQVLVIDAGYSTVTQNVTGRLQAAGHTVTVTTNTSLVPTATGTYQQVWDLRYSAALTSGEITNYTSFVTAGGFAYFVTENPGCCMTRNNSVAALITGLGGGSTQIGPGWANNVESNVNTTYMTSGITVNYAAVAAIVNSQGIPLIKDSANMVSGMSWIGRAGDLGTGVLGTIVTVADTNWLDSTRFAVGGTSAQTQNVQALDDIIRGIVAGTVGGTITAQGNGAAASNGAAQQQAQQTPPPPSTFDHTNTSETVATDKMTAGTFTGNGGTLQANANQLTVTNPIVLGANGMTYDANGLNSSLTGVISGVGGIAFSGTGTTTLTATNTYTGATGILSGATLINNGSIAASSGVANNGTFTNNGQAPGVNNVGTFTNSATGTAASLTNSGTASNAGTITGLVNNAGTFTNTGTTGDWYNSNTVNNTGTMGNGTNVGTFTNGGTVGTVTNNTGGTFTNNGTTGAVANNDTFVNNSTTGAVANTGTFTNAGTTGALTDNTGTFTNTGTTGDWLNNATVNNSGTMGNGTNNGTFTNAGQVGTVVNTGTFGNTGTLTSMNNSGTFITVPTTLTSYTQSSTGSTVLDYGSQLTVTGPASLGGNLTMVGTPYTLGKYTVLTGAPVSGTYSTYTGVGVLRYTPTGVQVWVMPDGSVVQAQANTMASNLSNANALATASINGALSNDCQTFGAKGGCVSVNYGATKVGTGDLNTTGVTAVKAIDSNWRVGFIGGANLNQPTVSGVKYEGVPTVGALVGWNENETGTGFGVTASAVTGGGNYVIGSNKTSTDGQAYQVKATYTKGLDGTTVLTPYIGVRRSTLNIDGFTPSGQLFPVTYGSVKQSTTDLLAGVSVSKKFDEKLTGTVNAGVVQNIANDAGAVTSTSDMGNFKAPLQGGHYTSAALGVGASYEVLPNQRVSVNAGWQQKSLTNSSITSYGVGYTVGF